MKVFNMASNTGTAYSDLVIILPYAAPSASDMERLENTLKTPLTLMTPTKKTEDFDVLQDVISGIQLDSSGDRPLLRISFSEKGWDRLAYLFLKNMAKQVKSNPKSMPRSYRSYANLMDKLTEHPTGNGKVDESRKVVIDRAVEQLTGGLRDELTRRAQAFRPIPSTDNIKADTLKDSSEIANNQSEELKN